MKSKMNEKFTFFCLLFMTIGIILLFLKYFFFGIISFLISFTFLRFFSRRFRRKMVNNWELFVLDDGSDDEDNYPYDPKVHNLMEKMSYPAFFFSLLYELKESRVPVYNKVFALMSMLFVTVMISMVIKADGKIFTTNVRTNVYAIARIIIKPFKRSYQGPRGYTDPEVEKYYYAAYLKYKIPIPILKAITNVESGGNVNTGKFNALNQLQQSSRHKKHIPALKRICASVGKNYRKVNGSKAGALGITQFMPLTWEELGADGNNDGIKDPWDYADAIMSTANFLYKKGWHKNYKNAIHRYNPWPDRRYLRKVLRVAKREYGWDGRP